MNDHAHPMIKAPTTAHEQLKGEVQDRAKATAQTTYTNKDREDKAAEAAALAARMLASKASKDDIMRAVGNISGLTMETADAAIAAAQKQIDIDKFNILSGGATTQSQSGGYAVVDMGGTTAALALMGLAGGFTNKAQDVRKPDPGQGITT